MQTLFIFCHSPKFVHQRSNPTTSLWLLHGVRTLSKQISGNRFSAPWHGLSESLELHWRHEDYDSMTPSDVMYGSVFICEHIYSDFLFGWAKPLHVSVQLKWAWSYCMWGSERDINLMSVFTSGWCQQPTNHRPRHSSALERHRECVEWGFGGLPIMMKNHCRTNLFPCPS